MNKAWLVRVDDVVKSLAEAGDDVTAELLSEQLQKLPCYCPGCQAERREANESLDDELPF